MAETEKMGRDKGHTIYLYDYGRGEDLLFSY